MSNNEKNTYPLTPVTSWWTLRNRFKQSIPTNITDTYIATVLNISPVSAKNILPSLKQIGILDQDGKVLELAKRWRDDESYPSVCEEIKSSVYPQELIDAIPDPLNNRDVVERWFANHTGSGQVAVRKMALFYLLLCEANPKKEPDKNVNSSKSKSKSTKPVQPKPKVVTQPKLNTAVNTESILGEQPVTNTKTNPIQENNLPSININLQIHISADASVDQIDQIFRSMAQNLYQKNIKSND